MSSNSSISEDLEQRFPNYKLVQALFSGGIAGDAPVFRLPLHDLGWEFSDGFNIGTVIQGTFYFNPSDLDELREGNETKAKYHIAVYETRESNWAYISLYKPGSETDLLGVFFGKDVRNVVASSKLYRTYRLEGSWKPTPKYLVATAQVLKNPGSTKFTITCPLLKAEFQCDLEDSLYASSVVTNGVLTIKDLERVHKVSTVKWYHDHLILYEDSDSTRYSSAYFYPNELGDKNVLGMATLGKEWGAVRVVLSQS